MGDVKKTEDENFLLIIQTTKIELRFQKINIRQNTDGSIVHTDKKKVIQKKVLENFQLKGTSEKISFGEHQ